MTPSGRPNAGFIVDDNTSHFESGGRRTDDYALRYQNNLARLISACLGLTGLRENRNWLCLSTRS